MPKLKQPITLKKFSFHVLLAHVVLCCDCLSLGGFFIALRQAIVHMKYRVRDHLPENIFSEFCEKLLEGYLLKIGKERLEKFPASHYRAALEIVMDVKNVGVACQDLMLRYLNPHDAHRIHWIRLEIRRCGPLDGRKVLKGLGNFCSQDLTTFNYGTFCTDLDLEIIGSHCKNLQFLDVHESQYVTDSGLRALRLCSDLRRVIIHACSVTDQGVNELLNFHTKLEEFNLCVCYDKTGEGFDALSRPISLVCPNIKRYSIQSHPRATDNLRSVVTLFPNLTYLRFWCPYNGDLSMLSDLKNLTELRFDYEFSMINLQQLLTIIGAKLSRLKVLLFDNHSAAAQNQLDFVYKFCGNIEDLEFDCEAHPSTCKLVIPPFEKLRSLALFVDFRNENTRGVLEFGTMSALECVSFEGSFSIISLTEAMMLDHVRFPNLKRVNVRERHQECIDRINEIAKINNLDFSCEDW